jgi:putative NADH-flavin reductase
MITRLIPKIFFNKMSKGIDLFEDYAMAMIDEVEQPTHIRQRFTVGY